MSKLYVSKLANIIDHTIIKSDATQIEIAQACQDAVQYGFSAVFVNPCRVKYAATLLHGTSIKVGVPIGFPTGANTTSTKVFEAQEGLMNGAEEFDMVLNIGAFKDGNYAFVRNDIEMVINAISGKICKVIIETQLLTEWEIKKACLLAKEAGAHLVKSNTGLFGGSATIKDIETMRGVVGNETGVKASGGIKTLQDALLLLQAGATRLGCSKSVDIIKEYEIISK